MAVSERQILDLLKEAQGWAGSRQLQGWADKLRRRRLRVAVFGLVNRGKSALINALVGVPLLKTGPLNGVTQRPERVGWVGTGSRLQVELVDTPGLEEVGGEARSQLAWREAQRADLILFVISGDLCQLEYGALLELRRAGKPVFLVFNKVDLYPSCDRELIYGQLTSPLLRRWVRPEQIFLVAAAPPPQKVRQVWLDGRVTETWEAPPPQVDALRQALATVLAGEGERLLRINVLRGLERRHRQEVKRLLAQPPLPMWGWMGMKALLWTLLPMADGLVSLVGDLGLIWQCHRYYRLPLGRRLWGVMGQVLVLNLWVAALAHWLQGWGWWGGGEALYLLLAWWGSRHIQGQMRSCLLQFGLWHHRDPQELLRQLWGEVKPGSILAGLEPRYG
ncbi:MAG: Era-like GTP-binding protein [Thermostichales cyanobacterium BF4_bins_65]